VLFLQAPTPAEGNEELKKLMGVLESVTAMAKASEADATAASQKAAEREATMVQQLAQKDETIVELTKAGAAERDGLRAKLEESAATVAALQQEVAAGKRELDELDKHATAVQKLAWERECAVKENLASLQRTATEKDEEIGFLEARLKAMPAETPEGGDSRLDALLADAAEYKVNTSHPSL
jgi:chromosome segregation ATPase